MEGCSGGVGKKIQRNVKDFCGQGMVTLMVFVESTLTYPQISHLLRHLKVTECFQACSYESVLLRKPAFKIIMDP